MIDRAREEVVCVKERTTPVSIAFSAIELLGYRRTALRAADQAKTGQQPKQVRLGLRWIVADVLGNQVATKLMEHSQTFPGFQPYLEIKHRDITHAFATNDDKEIFGCYDELAAAKYTQFQKARAAWMATLETAGAEVA